MPHYKKPALSITDQIALLEQRGMAVTDKKLAEQTLKVCNLYRFNGYALHFWINPSTRPQQYRSGTRFEDVLNLMNFDRELRLLTLDAIERLEVAVRSAITSEASLYYGSPHWYLERTVFKDWARYQQFLTQATKDFQRSREIFAKHYKVKYTEPPLPPSWVLAEISTFGTWSHLFENLKERNLRNQIARVFQISHERLQSNLHILNNTRNLCAHHSRLWNRIFTFTPSLSQAKGVSIPVLDHRSYAAQAGMIWVMLRAIEPSSHWTKELHSLIAEYTIEPKEMGFKPGWEHDPFWGI